MPTFHHDIAYLKPERDYTQKAIEILDKALALMEQDPKYTFTVEQAYFAAQYLVARPENLDKLKSFVKTGQLLFAPGFWSVPDMCMPSGESIYMQATVGKRLLRELFDYEPRTAYIADCWGHHAQLPQILTQCGYDYYSFSRCMDPKFDIENFRWKGIDGTVLNSHWMSTSYGGIVFPHDGIAENAEELNWEEATKEGILSRFAQNRKHCDDDIQLMPAGGDMMVPSKSSLEIVDTLDGDADMPEIAFSSFERALGEIDFTGKPVYDGEFISALKGSFATNIQIKQNNRELESGIGSLETLSVLKRRKVDLEPIWKTALKNQFHDILCGTICDDALVQVREEYRQAKDTLEQVRCELSKDGEKAYFNPLPFENLQILERDGNKVLLNGHGWDYAQETELQEARIPVPDCFENGYYRAEFDKQGFITRLVEKKSGKVLVNTGDIPFGSLVMQSDSGDNWVEFEYPWELPVQAYATNVPDPYDRKDLTTHRNVLLRANGVNAVSAVRLGNEAVQILQTGVLQYWITEIPFTTRITLYQNSPRIDYHTELECNFRRIRVRVAFPQALEQGIIRHQIPYGMVERGEGTQPAQYLMDVQDDAAGISLINRGLPANNTEDGIMMLTLFRSVAMEYKCQSEKSYNIGERLAFEYAILPHGSNDDDLLWRQSVSFQQPMVLTTKEPLAGFKVENALVSALRHDGDGVFIRVYNGTDRQKAATITLDEAVTDYAFTDGLMDPGQKESISGVLELSLPPYAVKGIKFYYRETEREE